MSETSKGNCDVQIVLNKSVVEIRKPKEGLNVFNLARLRPVHDDLNFGWVHAQALGSDEKA